MSYFCCEELGTYHARYIVMKSGYCMQQSFFKGYAGASFKLDIMINKVTLIYNWSYVPIAKRMSILNNHGTLIPPKRIFGIIAERARGS